MYFLKKFKDLDKYTRLSVIVIALGIILRFALVFLYHPSGDACWHLSVSRFIANNFRIPLLEPLGREVFWEPPVFHVIAAAFYKIFSIFGIKAAESSMKLVSPIFGSLSLIVTLMILDALFGKKTAFYSIIFATFLPINIFYGTIAYTESLMTFFVLLSVYLIIKNRYVLGSIAFGISLLSKYNAVFTLPLIIYLMYKNNKPKEFFKKFFIFGIVAALIFLQWMIRNYISLHNPLWPFFTSVFHGYESVETFKGNNISSILNINNLFSLYLGIFGVPEGNYQNIFFFKIPFIEMLFAVWLMATFLFIIPMLFYSGKKDASSKINALLLIWFVPHLLLIMLYVINTSIAYSRLLVPVVPLFSAVWGLGFSYVLDKLKRFKAVIFFILAILVIGFVAGEFIKGTLVSKAWNFYQEDFDWVKSNTDPKAIFIANGQCIPYNIERTSLYANIGNLNKADYAWVNQNFKLDSRSKIEQEKLTIVIEKFDIAYSNLKTGTLIYKRKK